MERYFYAMLNKWFKLWLAIFALLSIGIFPAYAQDSANANTEIKIPDTLLFRIQKSQSVIQEIANLNKRGFNISRIEDGLLRIKENVAPIDKDISTAGNVQDGKTLINYNLILRDALFSLNNWSTSLAKSTNDLQHSLDKVVTLSKDSLLVLSAGDDSLKRLYSGGIASLKLQLQEAGTLTTKKLDTVSHLLADVSATIQTTTNLQSAISGKLDSLKQNVFRKEVPYLWSAPFAPEPNKAHEIVASTYDGQNRILKYFIATTWDNRIMLILITIVFFFWVVINYKKAAREEIMQKTGKLNFIYLQPLPFLASLIILFNLTPLFEPSAPSLYVELTQFVLLLLVSVQLFWKRPENDMRLWVFNLVLYILLLLSVAIINASVLMRLWLILLNAGFIYIGIEFYQKLRHAQLEAKFIRPVNLLNILLQTLAIIMNISGRVSLAKSLTLTAEIGLTQTVGIAVFIQIILDAMELQIKVSSSSGGLFSRVSVAHTRRTIKRVLTFVGITLWLIVFLINLGVASSIYDFIYSVSAHEHKFGSITFTIGNIFLFFLVIYLAASLQKNVDLLFGESHISSANQEIEQKSSKLALIRLIIVVSGVLIAVTASGISLDKFTVVLGALSVGIGLGMQNIVSNFVSGIILIFEKPFRIGDYIELADKKGRIKDIGIRSSKMITGLGSEVIIPNGDFLSNRLVNWTSENTYMKSELTFKINADANMETVEKIIHEQTGNAEHTLKNLTPDILINSITTDSIELKVLVWINSIYTEPAYKSHLLLKLLEGFKSNGIKMM